MSETPAVYRIDEPHIDLIGQHRNAVDHFSRMEWEHEGARLRFTEARTAYLRDDWGQDEFLAYKTASEALKDAEGALDDGKRRKEHLEKRLGFHFREERRRA